MLSLALFGNFCNVVFDIELVYLWLISEVELYDKMEFCVGGL
jgi:hypothetical protein